MPIYCKSKLICNWNILDTFVFFANPPHTHTHTPTHVFNTSALQCSRSTHKELQCTVEHTHTHIHSRLLGAWRRGPEGTQLSCVIYQRSLPHQFLSSESIHSMRRATSPSSDRDTSSGMFEAARKAFRSSQRPSVAVTEISVWLNTCRSFREADGPL